jgi:single-stranded-DNA-specific exonuclease
MGDAATAVKLLIAETPEEAQRYARDLERINESRRDEDKKTMDAAVSMIESQPDTAASASLILHQADWHLGVIGIVASRIVDRYSRPAIMLSSVEGLVKGSARSVRGFNVFDALRRCNDLLVQFGGHEFAAGLTLQQEDLEAFRNRFNEIVTEEFRPEAYEPEFMIDAKLNLNEIGVWNDQQDKYESKFWKVLRQFEPHGPGNHVPVFLSEGLRMVGTPSVIRSGHLKFRVQQGNSAIFEAIAFKQHNLLPFLREHAGQPLSLVYTLEENTWNGKTTLQLRVKDIRITKPHEIVKEKAITAEN